MIRLDKFLCDVGLGTRTEVKQLIKKGLVQVNNETIKKSEYKIDEEKDTVLFQGKEIGYEKNVYIMLHKPARVVSATEDTKERTVLDCCQGIAKDLFDSEEGYVLPVQSLNSSGQLTQAFQELYEKRVSIREHLCKTIPDYCAKASVALDAIKELVKQ